jgi:phosphoribosylformimino-5-aminoimidazole carboxamide ribotide isomerase
MSFFVIPAVDLKDGKCVRLVQGDPKHKTVELENPGEVAQSWQDRGAQRLHLIDLDGALQGVRKNEKIVREIVTALEIPVQFGGGIRSYEDAINLLDLGIDKIILGTVAMERPEMLERLAEEYGRNRFIVALDSKSGKVVIKGWVEDTDLRAVDVAKKFEDFASEYLFTNVDVEGMIQGINIDVIKAVVGSTTSGIIASGGISTLGDIQAVKDAGASAVVIGTALYKGRIDFKEALKIQEK